MTGFNQHLYNPYTDGIQTSLDEGFTSSIKEKLGLAPKQSGFSKALSTVKSKLGLEHKPESGFSKALSGLKGKLGMGPKKGKLDQAMDYLKANKGKLAARAAGSFGTHALYNKLSGSSYKDDVLHGGLKGNLKRMAISHAGGNLGELIYNKFDGKG